MTYLEGGKCFLASPNMFPVFNFGKGILIEVLRMGCKQAVCFPQGWEMPAVFSVMHRRSAEVIRVIPRVLKAFTRAPPKPGLGLEPAASFLVSRAIRKGSVLGGGGVLGEVADRGINAQQ